jgi:hypothetical protein
MRFSNNVYLLPGQVAWELLAKVIKKFRPDVIGNHGECLARAEAAPRLVSLYTSRIALITISG